MKYNMGVNTSAAAAATETVGKKCVCLTKHTEEF